MNASEIIDSVAKATGLPKSKARIVVRTFIKSTIEALKIWDEVRLRDFGTFKIHKRIPYIGRDPRTGQRILVKAVKIPKFVPSKSFRRALD